MHVILWANLEYIDGNFSSFKNEKYRTINNRNFIGVLLSVWQFFLLVFLVDMSLCVNYDIECSPSVTTRLHARDSFLEGFPGSRWQFSLARDRGAVLKWEG